MANSKNSVITHARRVNLAQITCGAVSTIPKISHIAFGDEGLDESGQPLDPTEFQQALHHEVGRYPIDQVEHPKDTTNRYIVTIPETELNGSMLSEMALVDEDGGLAAIKNFLPKGKDEDVRFTFEFDDEF